jgi:hypothetical protein
MKLKFYVYIIEDESYIDQRKVILIKLQEQGTYSGFDTYADAENWIVENGEKRTEYTILPTYRRP